MNGVEGFLIPSLCPRAGYNFVGLLEIFPTAHRVIRSKKSWSLFFFYFLCGEDFLQPMFLAITQGQTYGRVYNVSKDIQICKVFQYYIDARREFDTII
jgi:hypothetical protein